MALATYELLEKANHTNVGLRKAISYFSLMKSYIGKIHT